MSRASDGPTLAMSRRQRLWLTRLRRTVTRWRYIHPAIVAEINRAEHTGMLPPLLTEIYIEMMRLRYPPANDP